MNTAGTSVSLTWLLDGIAVLPANEARVCDLSLDSRQVRAGGLFFALPGHHTHGLDFVAAAIARGASVVLWDPEAAGDRPRALAAAARGADAAGLIVAPVAGLKQLVGRIADRFFGWPSSHLRIVGITGTNGKTTCAHLVAQCLTGLGVDAAYMGTLGWGRTAALESPTHTTPDAVTVHRQLAALRALGVRDIAMEVSSHALDQGRVDAVRFHTAAFTNLTRDHLDYHGTMEAYGAAKERLFTAVDLQSIVINVGDEFGRRLAARHRGRAPVTAAWVGSADLGWLADRALRADELRAQPDGLSMTLDGTFGQRQLVTRLLGRFNAENAVVVVAALLAAGVSFDAAVLAVAQCAPPPGRMEVLAAAGGGPLAVIDYAHTPDALAKALRTAKEHCRGLLWCVFGCGGDRDPGKRPLMGAIADEIADRIIVTDDNPRNEDPRVITRGIVDGITSQAARVIHDRAAAIAAALTEAAPDDVVLIAGKGHEDYQIYGDARRSFSDRHEALRHLGAAA